MDLMYYAVGALVLIGVGVLALGTVRAYRRQKRGYLNMGD